MLPSKNRVERHLLSSVFNRGRRYHSEYFTLIIAPSQSNRSHISFVASKKAVGGAVARHKAVRRGYSAMRGMIARINPPSVCIFYFKKSAGGLSYKDIERAILELLYRAGLIDKQVP